MRGIIEKVRTTFLCPLPAGGQKVVANFFNKPCKT
jgi:hypothetical protein